MIMTNNNSQGSFAMPIIIAIVILVVVSAGVAYFATRTQPSPTGTTEVPTGEKTLPDGTVVKADGTMIKANGTMIKPDGTMIKPNETMEKKEDETMMKKEEGVMMKGTVLAGKTAKIFDFNKEDYEKAIASDKLIVLYFYANWCPICRLEIPKFYKSFDNLSTDRVIGFRINFNDGDTDNDEKNLAREFGVAYQHTKVFLKNGQRILKSPETWNEERYLSEINKYLNQ